jgi:hypothetical protein
MRVGRERREVSKRSGIRKEDILKEVRHMKLAFEMGREGRGKCAEEGKKKGGGEEKGE